MPGGDEMAAAELARLLIVNADSDTAAVWLAAATTVVRDDLRFAKLVLRELALTAAQALSMADEWAPGTRAAVLRLEER